MTTIERLIQCLRDLGGIQDDPTTLNLSIRAIRAEPKFFAGLIESKDRLAGINQEIYGRLLQPHEDLWGNNPELMDEQYKPVIRAGCAEEAALIASAVDSLRREQANDSAISQNNQTAKAYGRKRRAIILHRIIISATDFKDRTKVKALCDEFDKNRIPIPARKDRILSGKAGPHGFQPKTWNEIYGKATSAEYKRLFGSRTSPLLRELYSGKKRK